MTTVLDLATDDTAVASIAQRVFAVMDRPAAIDDRDALIRALPVSVEGAPGMELRTIRRRAGLHPHEASALWRFLDAV